MRKLQFKAESKKLLDMMINSIYTNPEIFLRELISNASDAIDKLYYKSLTDDAVNLDKDDFCIKIDIDKDKRQLVITDNGIGMDEEDAMLCFSTHATSKLYKEDDLYIVRELFFYRDKLLKNALKEFGAKEIYAKWWLGEWKEVFHDRTGNPYVKKCR